MRRTGGGCPAERSGKKSIYKADLVRQDGIIPYLCAVVSSITIIPAKNSYMSGAPAEPSRSSGGGNRNKAQYNTQIYRTIMAKKIDLTKYGITGTPEIL